MIGRIRARLVERLAPLGLTALTDAGAGNGPEEARLLAGKLPQRLTLMVDESLVAGEGYRPDPLKLLFDEHDFPEGETLAARISSARGPDSRRLPCPRQGQECRRFAQVIGRQCR